MYTQQPTVLHITHEFCHTQATHLSVKIKTNLLNLLITNLSLLILWKRTKKLGDNTSEKSEIHKDSVSNLCSGTLEMVGKNGVIQDETGPVKNKPRQGEDKLRVSQDL